MKRERIKLTNNQWENLVYECCLEIDSVEFEEIDDVYDGSRRHTEDHHKILQRESDMKFFRLDYEISVKDEMGWEECNYGDTEAVEVFEEIISKSVYK
ncbi:MAG: hypothetical protein PF569_01805 [Candidatus Woesearchaeota archaeon]|jgi:hypothetical protein|nr:hypothetical protein [Candidatus Woesearchaeota archaeon]